MSKNKRRVTEPQARAAYLKMPGRRSSKAVRDRFIRLGWSTPSIRRFDIWRSRHKWVSLAREHDRMVADGVLEAVAKETTKTVVSRAKQFDELSTESLQASIDGLKELDRKSLKATDIRALAEVSVSAARMVELLEGRATERKDDLTRQDMDKLMEDMADELNERLKFTSDTIH